MLIMLGASHYLSAGGGGGGGLGNFRGGGVMKKFLPQMGGQNFIYESMGGGGGVTNMISISFSGIKMLWLLGGFAPQDPLSHHYFFFSSFMPHFSPPPPKN